MSLRIILVDDHVVIREAIRDIIVQEDDFEVIAEAGDGREAVKYATELLPDVVVMDISMPNLNGVEATRQIVSSCRQVSVLVLSMHSDRILVTEMLKAGATGFIEKNCTFSEMITAIRTVGSGRTYLSPTIANLVVDGFLGKSANPDSAVFSVLSPREREVLQLLAEGKSTKDIAFQLNVSVSTIETHRRQLKNKLNIKSFAGLIKFAIKEGLTTL